LNLPTGSIDWWRVIVDLERHSYTHGSIAAAVGVARGTVHGWKVLHAEPRHSDGQRILALWSAVTKQDSSAAPVRAASFSAAAMR
jgi:hypothetical protein